MVLYITIKAGITMTPEDFDISFDFDKEYDLDPNANKSSFDDDFDLDAALERELGPDFDRLFEEEFAASQAALNAKYAAQQKTSRDSDEDDEEDDHSPIFGAFSNFDDNEDLLPEEAEEDDDAFLEEEAFLEDEEDEEEDEADEEEDVFGLSDFDLPMEEDDIDEETAEEYDDPDEDLSAVFNAVSASREELPEVEFMEEPAEEPAAPAKKKLDLHAITDKIDLSGIKGKFAAMGGVIRENGRTFLDALKECKPGKMDRKAKRRFKNDVLPFLIGGAAAILCLVFIIGSLGRAMNSEERKQAALEASIAQAEAEAAAAAEIDNILTTSAIQAAGYDYQAAINTLDSYKTEERGLTEEMVAARAEYAEAVNSLVIWDDPTAIPNLSFHVLIADPDRAYADSLASSYKSLFVTTDQFSAILEDLYDNDYVLVNLDSCLTETVAADGSTTCTIQPLYLPDGKKPIMITETLVNYFAYMVDPNKDGTPDANGAGFAHKLVLKDGKLVNEYIDADGNQLVGNYDLVPILNSFIEAHPDFSYRGAKAILAVTGDEGVFGWRTNKGDEATIAGAKEVVAALRTSGYQIACNSYSNLNYGSTSLELIEQDLTNWKTKISPILDEVDIMVIARSGNIGTASSQFKKICDADFRYVLDAGTTGTRLDAAYFYQNRVTVTGSDLFSGIYAAYFTLNSE